MVCRPFENWVYRADKVTRLTLCNLCLAVFLALKNTPLSPLAGRSYENINTLHRCVGYTTIVFMILHSTIYIGGLAKSHALTVLMRPGQYAAIFAAFCFLTIGVTAAGFFRRRLYELFFIVHVTLVAGMLISRKYEHTDVEAAANRDQSSSISSQSIGVP